MQDVVRFWLGRGVDGFRLDAIDRLVQGRAAARRPARERAVPAAAATRRPRRSRCATPGNRPEAIEALRALREAAGDALLVGEVYRPVGEYARWLEVLDLVFAFEFLFSPWDAERLRAAIEPAAELGRAAWVMSNHDFDRLATRVGPENLRAAAVLLLTLPGVAFVYQGDEIGLANGPGARAALRPRRPRPAAPPDAVGRGPRRLHDRRAVAAARRPRGAQRRRRSAATPARCSSSTAA